MHGPGLALRRLAPPVTLVVLVVLAAVLAGAPRRGLASEPRVVTIILDGDAVRARDEGAWLPVRLADLLARRLGELGLGVRDRRFLDARARLDAARAGGQPAIILRVRPEAALEPGTTIALEAELRDGAARPVVLRRSSQAGALGAESAALALALGDALGASAGAEAARAGARRAIADLPFSVERTLGLARAAYDAERFRQALLFYDRAADLSAGALLEAAAGRRLVEAELIARGESEFGARADLAPSAAERAAVAEKRGDLAEAARALAAYVRFTPDRALRWSLELPLRPGRSALLAHGPQWVVQDEGGERRRLTIDPRTGAILGSGPAIHGLVDIVAQQPLVLDGRTLERLDPQGRPRWRVDLPITPRGAGPDAADVTSGLVGVLGARGVAWVDLSFGAVAQVAAAARPLAAGSGGVVVELGRDLAEAGVAVALLRPGKQTPAWQVPSPALPESVAMTADRILLVTGGVATASSAAAAPASELTLLYALDGKRAGAPLPLPRGTRIIGAEGRYAALAAPGRRVIIADVLAGAITGLVQGPASAVAACPGEAGVAVLYETGDLLFYDRDGSLLDRALVPGTPIGLARGSAMAPGPVAVTTRGLFAFAEVTPGGTRDVDALVSLARILARTNDVPAALRLASEVAWCAAGRIGEAESLRASLLERGSDPEDRARAQAARRRASAAGAPAEALGPFMPFMPFMPFERFEPFERFGPVGR